MTHKDLFEALIAGEHIGHKGDVITGVNIYLDDAGNLVGKPWDFYLENLIVRPPWYERIPRECVLCWLGTEGFAAKRLGFIERYEDGNFFEPNSTKPWKHAVPVKKSEVQFMEDF